MSRLNDFVKESDKIIGSRIQKLRIERGFSREDLGKEIGTSHQQIAKYENGIDRIAIGRLILVAKKLNEKVSYFYENLEDGIEELTDHQRLAIEASRNFTKIKDIEKRKMVSKLIRTFVVDNVMVL